MAASSEADTRRLLQESIEQLVRVPSGTPEDGISAFNSLRRGVTHATNGREVPAERILGDLEPKDGVLRFLRDLHEKKKMYRKQVESVFTALLKVDSWLLAAQTSNGSDLMPSDLVSLLNEREAARGTITCDSSEVLAGAEAVTKVSVEDTVRSVSPVTANVGMQEVPKTEECVKNDSLPEKVPSDAAIREAVDAARAADAARAEVARGKTSSNRVRGASDLEAAIEQSRQKMEALEFCATNKDNAIEVFELFRRTVMSCKRDSGPLARLEPKHRIIEFLVDVHKKHTKHRRRVASVFMCLWAFQLWKEAIQLGPAMHAAVCEIILDSGVSPDTLGTEIASLVAADRATESAGNILSSDSGNVPDGSESLAVLLCAVEDHQAKLKNFFPGDKTACNFLEQVALKMREIGRVTFCGDCSRFEYANGMIRPELALRKAPLYSVEFTQSSGADGVILFFKRLVGGWSVKIDRSTFEALAYGDRELPPKAHENVHMLSVRGHVLRSDRIPPPVLPRVSVVTACDDELHRSRNATSKKRLQEKEERARDMGFAGVEHVVDSLSVLELQELDLFLEKDACKLSRGNRSTLVPLKQSMILRACHDELLTLIEENIERISQAFESSLCKMDFAEKVDYWEALRTSSATSQKLLVNLFDACLRGNTAATQSSAKVFENARSIAEQYVKDYPGNSPSEVADRLVQWQASLNLSTGFVTGFGGFLTMPVTIPTGMLATWIVSTRLAFAVAHIFGHDIFHPCTVNAVLYCLTGSSATEGTEKGPEDDFRARLSALLQRQGRIRNEMEGLDLQADSPNSEVHDATLVLSPCSEDFKKQYATLYDLFGIRQDASQQDVRVAYRRIALLCHPDKLQSKDPEQIRIATQRFQVLSAAYEVLGDSESRVLYDRSLSEGSWSWAEFSWDRGLEQACCAFEGATTRLTEGLLAKHYKNYDCSGHMVSRAVAQIAVDVAEAIQVSSAKSLVQAASAAELRSSIAAGERLAASAATRSSSKLIPILGALVSGAIDCATTASVGRCAVRVFKV